MSQHQEYYIDTERKPHSKECLKLNDLISSPKSYNWIWSDDPLFETSIHDNSIKIYESHEMSTRKNGLIIIMNDKLVIIQVADDTKIDTVLHSHSELEMDMSLDDALDEDCVFRENVVKNSIELLFHNILLIILFNQANKDDIKFFIDEFNHESIGDSVNRRFNDKSMKCDSDPESDDEYTEPYSCCSSIINTNVEHYFWKIDSSNYLRSMVIYQLFKQGSNSILIIKEYSIEFTKFNATEIIIKNQIHFSIPNFKSFTFDEILLSEVFNNCYLFILYYKDATNEKFLMKLEIIKDLSNEMIVKETYDECVYIYRFNDKTQIYKHDNVKDVPKYNKLIGYIDFGQNDDGKFLNAFIQSHITRI